MDTLVDRLRAIDEEALYLAGLSMYADGVPFGLECRLPAWHQSMSETLLAGLTASYHNDPDAFEHPNVNAHDDEVVDECSAEAQPSGEGAAVVPPPPPPPLPPSPSPPSLPERQPAEPLASPEQVQEQELAQAERKTVATVERKRTRQHAADEAERDRPHRTRSSGPVPNHCPKGHLFSAFDTVLCNFENGTKVESGLAHVTRLHSDGAYDVVFFSDMVVSRHVPESHLRLALRHRGPAGPIVLPTADDVRRAGRHAVAQLPVPEGTGVDFDVADGRLEEREAGFRPGLSRSATSCHGELLLPSLSVRRNGKRACAPLGPNSWVHFLGSKVGSRGQPVALSHGTCTQEKKSERRSPAHISAVAQHDCAILGLTITESAGLTRDAQLAVQADVLDPKLPARRSSSSSALVRSASCCTRRG